MSACASTVAGTTVSIDRMLTGTPQLCTPGQPLGPSRVGFPGQPGKFALCTGCNLGKAGTRCAPWRPRDAVLLPTAVPAPRCVRLPQVHVDDQPGRVEQRGLPVADVAARPVRAGDGVAVLDDVTGVEQVHRRGEEQLGDCARLTVPEVAL